MLLMWTSGEFVLVGPFSNIWMCFGMNIRQTMMQPYEGTLFYCLLLRWVCFCRSPLTWKWGGLWWNHEGTLFYCWILFYCALLTWGLFYRSLCEVSLYIYRFLFYLKTRDCGGEVDVIEYVMYLTWMSSNASCIMQVYVIECVVYVAKCMSSNASCIEVDVFECVMYHGRVSGHAWMSDVAHMKESCQTYAWVMPYMWMNQTYEWVVPHKWLRHATHMKSHATHMNEWCHTC